MARRHTRHPKSKCPCTQKKFSQLPGIRRIWTYILGCHKTSDYHDRLQISYHILSSKKNPPPLRNACDFVLQFNLTIAHNPRKMNNSADFFSRLEIYPNEKIFLNFREDLPTKPIEVNIKSTGITQEEPVFFDTTDQQETTQKELWKRKEGARTAIPNDPPVITAPRCYATDLHKVRTIVKIAQVTKPSRILIEQDSGPTLLNFKREMLGLPFDEQILKKDARNMQFSQNKNVLSSKMIYSFDNTITTLAKLLTYRSFCRDNYSKCYYNHYMEQLVNTQAFQKSCKKFDKNTTFLQ